MARIAFENGVDLILGHSAHRLQGIEVVDGKVVIYDMGNLLFDCKLKPEGQQSGLFRIHLSTDGVHKIEIIPTQALNGHTVLAGHEQAHEILTEMRDLCSALGTSLLIDEDLEGRPVGVIDIGGVWMIPPAELAPRVELLASRLPDTAIEGGILHLSTWWRVTGPVDRNIMPAFRLSVEGETPRRGTPWYTRHDPGDWTVPLSYPD